MQVSVDGGKWDCAGWVNFTFTMFQKLQENYGIPRTDFFRYLHVQHFVKTHLHNFDNAESDMLDLCFGKILIGKHAISYLCGIL